MMTVKNTSSAIEAVTMMWLVTVNVYGMMPIMFAIRMNMNSVKTSGKNFMPAVPAVLCMHVGHELVGEFGDRLHPARHQRARELPPTSSAATPTTVIAMKSAELVIAISCPPMWAMRGEFRDLELMNWIGHRTSPSRMI